MRGHPGARFDVGKVASWNRSTHFWTTWSMLPPAWREMKRGRVAPLGPRLVVDRQSGEAHLALGPSTYCVGREGAARKAGLKAVP